MKKYFPIIVGFLVLGVLCVGKFTSDTTQQVHTGNIQKIFPTIVGVSAYSLDQSKRSATGVIVTQDGGVLTSKHIVSEGSRYSARLSTGEEVELQLIPNDPERDLAYFWIISPDKVFYQFAQIIPSQATIAIGEAVRLLGSLDGILNVAAGIISSINSTIDPVTGGQQSGLLKIDATIESGFSGGPTVLLDGTVIGITTALAGANTGRTWSTPVSQDDLKYFVK